MTLEDIKTLLSLVERTAQEVLAVIPQPLFHRERTIYNPAHHILTFNLLSARCCTDDIAFRDQHQRRCYANLPLL